MKHHFPFPLVLSLLFLEPGGTFGHLKPSRPSVCIVGGGITGLVIANRLLKAGESVVLFEKSSDHIGGKLDTEKQWNVVWEKGPVLFSSGEEAVLRYLKKFGLHTIPWSGQNVAYFDPTTAIPSTLSEAELVKMRTELTPLVKKYVVLRGSYPPWVWEPRGFEHVHLLKSSHPDLFLSTEEWLRAHGLGGLEFVFAIVFRCEGYGHLRDLPILYAMRLLAPKVTASLGELILGGDHFVNNDIFTIQEGFSELAFQMVERIRHHENGLVFMDHQLVKVFRKNYTRNGGRVRLNFRTAQGTYLRPTIDWCKKVVLSFPPLLSKLSRIVDNINLREKTILSRVKVHKYFSSGHILEGQAWNKFVYLGLTNNTWQDGDGRPIALVRSGKGGENAYIVYSWLYGRYDSGPAPDDYGYIDDLLLSFLGKFHKGPPKLSFLEGYEYFPHVKGGDFKDGWGADFASLQGGNGVYFASPVMSFESVNTAIENPEAVADLIRFT